MSGSPPYIDQDTRDEIQRAVDAGADRDVIAGQIGMDLPELCSLMGWPQWRPVPTVDDRIDLWAADRLTEVL